MELEKILPSNGPSIDEVKKYINKYSNDIIVIKCGGSVLLEKNLFDQFIEDISIINKLGLSAVVVHGGGKNIKKKLDHYNLKSEFIDGLRVTDEKTIKVVEEALLELNFEILNKINKHQANAYPITPNKNNVIKVVPERPELGFVGSPINVDQSIIDKIIADKKVPVIAPLGLDKNDQTYNVNADTAAGYIAKKINARRLIILSDVEGVLDNNKNLIPEINSESIKKLIDNETITGGMIPKINNCLDVASNGVKGVVIIDGRKNHSLLFELLSDEGSGTLIRQ